MRDRRNRPLGRFAVAGLAFASFASSNWAVEQSPFYAAKTGATRPSPDFTLTDQNGKPFSSTILRGDLALVAFGFTSCPNICPTTLAHLANIDKALSPEERKQIQVLFISVDPERDTPGVLKSYVHFFDSRFIGLTGRTDQVAEVAKSYGVETSDYNIGHSTGVFIVGRSGACLGYYRENQLGATQRVVSDLRRFLTFRPEDEHSWQAERVSTVKLSPSTGHQVYLEQCVSCHREDGRGVPGKYPSLVESDWVLGARNRLVALTLDGVRGGHKASEESYKGVMPAYRTILTPRHISEVLTYIRQSWGNTASSISAGYVQKMVSTMPPRTSFWSWEELHALPADQSNEPKENDHSPIADSKP